MDKETYDAAMAEAKAITDVDHEKVVAAGGLHIIGTERHESRRIDNQLRGRAARQGDPGSSRFYLSLDDDLMKRFASERVAGLMERMGLEDDVAIESRLVSKTIESAQTRVEGFNFDIRKRVVEFDDVINRQRETIYAERDKVLRNEDLTETVREFLDDEVEAIGDQYLGGDVAGRVEPRGADGRAARDGPRRPGDLRGGAGRGRTIPRRARASTSATWRTPASRRSQQEHGDEVWSQVERFVLLRTIDSLWVEHLTELDDMRRGIGLRGYAQQDPLNEFRKEAFRLYEELLGPDPAPGRHHHLPGHRPARARDRAAPRPRPARPCRRRATRRAGRRHATAPRRPLGHAQAPRAPLAAGQAALRQPAAGHRRSIRGPRPPRRPDAQRARGPG